MAEPRDWLNLARQVRERRDTLGLTQEDVAQKGGPSTATQREIERGKPMRKRPSSYRNLEKALELRPGSAMRALLGGRLKPLEEPAPPEPAPRHDAEDESLGAFLTKLLAKWDKLTPEEFAAERRRILDEDEDEDEDEANGPGRRAG